MRLSAELRDRAKRFGAAVIRLYVGLPKNRGEVQVVGHQLLRAGTSVAAHAREASRARSEAEFCSKLDCLLQEADEAQLWLELLNEECAVEAERTRPLWKEADELIAIFTTISARTKGGRVKGETPRPETLKAEIFQPLSVSACQLFAPFLN